MRCDHQAEKLHATFEENDASGLDYRSVVNPACQLWGLHPWPTTCTGLEAHPLKNDGRLTLCFGILGHIQKSTLSYASLAQLAEHALRKRMVVGSIPTGGWESVSSPPS